MRQKISFPPHAIMATQPHQKGGQRQCCWCGCPLAEGDSALLLDLVVPNGRRSFRAFHRTCALEMARVVEQVAAISAGEERLHEDSPRHDEEASS